MGELEGPRLPVFTDDKVNGFSGGAWGAPLVLSSSVVHSGTTSIQLASTFGTGFEIDGAVQSSFSGLELWVHGGSAGGQRLVLEVMSGSSRVMDADLEDLLGGAIPAGEWRKVTVAFPERTKGPDIFVNLKGQDESGSDVYVDDISLVYAVVGTCSREMGESCSDGDVCNGAESCNGQGNCLAGVLPSLDDGNPCTADSCGPSGIVHVAEAIGASCTLGDSCEAVGVCDVAGVCQSASGPVDLRVYDDAFQACFQDVSVGAYDDAATGRVYAGSRAVSFASDLVIFSSSVPGHYAGVQLWVNSPGPGTSLARLGVYDSVRSLAWVEVLLAGDGQWRRLDVPFAAPSTPGLLNVTISRESPASRCSSMT